MQVIARIPVGPSLWDVEFGAGSVWATSEFNGTLARIDPTTNATMATIKVGQAPRQVRYGAGAIWVGNHAGKSIFRVDPATNKAKAVPVGLLSPGLDRRQRPCDLGDVERGQPRRQTRSAHAEAPCPVKVGLGPANAAFAARRERLRPEHWRWDGQPDRPGDEQGRRDLQGRAEAVPGRGRVRRRLGPGRGRNQVVRFHVG